MGLCHIVEKGVAGYLNASGAWDKRWISPINGTQKVLMFSAQAWPSQMVSYIVVKCDSVESTQGGEESRMIDATVFVEVNGKVEPVEFESKTMTDGTGSCDSLDYITPFIRNAEHARKIVKYNAEQMSLALGGDMDTLAAAIQGYFPTYTGTIAEICQGACPTIAINDINVERSEITTSGAMTTDSLELTIRGYFEEFAL